MLNWFNKPQKDLDKAVDDLGVKIDDIIAERDALQQKLTTLQNILQKDAVAIDFSIIKVFSIERNTHEDVPCTIIGYLGEGSQVHEWYLYCSSERHEELVNDFINFKKNRDARMYNELKA